MAEEPLDSMFIHPEDQDTHRRKTMSRQPFPEGHRLVIPILRLLEADDNRPADADSYESGMWPVFSPHGGTASQRVRTSQSFTLPKR